MVMLAYARFEVSTYLIVELHATLFQVSCQTKYILLQFCPISVRLSQADNMPFGIQFDV